MPMTVSTEFQGTPVSGCRNGLAEHKFLSALPRPPAGPHANELQAQARGNHSSKCRYLDICPNVGGLVQLTLVCGGALPKTGLLALVNAPPI
jgi:hypothetical protein